MEDLWMIIGRLLGILVLEPTSLSSIPYTITHLPSNDLNFNPKTSPHNLTFSTPPCTTPSAHDENTKSEEEMAFGLSRREMEEDFYNYIFGNPARIDDPDW